MLEMILSISIIILAGIVLCLNIKLLKQLKKIEENNKSDESIDQTYTYDDVPKKSAKSSYTLIAGVILIIAGTLALISFIQVLTIDVNTLELRMQDRGGSA